MLSTESAPSPMSDSKKLYRQIADSIAADIQAGRYKAGERLPTERDLAAQYGVSRPTMREALIALEILGLIEARHGFGILVTGTSSIETITDSEIGAFELIEARRLFEGEVAAMAATQVTDQDIAELEALMKRMGDPDPARAVQADREFHLTIANITGNGAMVACIENLWEWRYRSPLAKLIMSRADLGMKQRIHEHSDILDALKQRSATAARAAMHDHLDRVIEHLLTATEVLAVESAKQESHERRKAISRRLKAISA